MSYSCTVCHGQGVFFATKKDKGDDHMDYVYAFRCDCSWGRNDGRQYPRWSKEVAKTYQPDRSLGPQEPKPLPIEPKAIPVEPSEPKPNVTPYAPKLRPVDFFDGTDEEELF